MEKKNQVKTAGIKTPFQKHRSKKYTLKTEIALAVIPTTTILIVLMATETFGRQQILFSSLACSAFLIYLDPEHQVNTVRTLLIAQTSAAIIGYVAYTLVGWIYLSAAISMLAIISLMIFTKAVHPPAISTCLIFIYNESKLNTLFVFLSALILLILLIGLQKISVWLIRRDKKLQDDE